jgi:hypothetical protein
MRNRHRRAGSARPGLERHRCGGNRAQWWCSRLRRPDDRGGLAAATASRWYRRNWAADPFDELPTLPPQLGLGVGDDLEAVNARDAIVRHYDELYRQGGWTRRRLLLKVADDPLRPSTTRQLLTGLGVLTVLLVWRSAVTKR